MDKVDGVLQSALNLEVSEVAPDDVDDDIHVFFYKHGVFQSEARICLSFSQIEPQNMLKICLS